MKKTLLGALLCLTVGSGVAWSETDGASGERTATGVHAGLALGAFNVVIDEWRSGSGFTGSLRRRVVPGVVITLAGQAMWLRGELREPSDRLLGVGATVQFDVFRRPPAVLEISPRFYVETGLSRMWLRETTDGQGVQARLGPRVLTNRSAAVLGLGLDFGWTMAATLFIDDLGIHEVSAIIFTTGTSIFWGSQ